MKELKFMVLKDDEFAVLCALYGITHFFGSLEMGEVKLSKQDIYTLIYQLYKKGLLISDKDKVTLNEEAKKICQGLSEATRLLSLVNPLTSDNQSFYYNSQTSLCINLQKSWEDPHSIRLRCSDKEEVIKIAEEAEMLPRQTLDEISIKHAELDEDAPMLMEYLRVNVYDLATDESLIEVHVGQMALNTVLEYTDKIASYKEVYRLDHLKSLITTLLQGEKRDDNG